MIRVNSILQKIGFSKAVAFGVFAKVWQSISGVVTLFLVARQMSPEEQGIYYTFSSLLALQSFFELSMYLVIINTASHEWAFLTLNEQGFITGEAHARSRLISLGRLIFKWYSIASLLFVFVVSIIGYVFIQRVTPAGSLVWQAPWFMLVILTGFQLLALPFNSLLEGCNQVTIIQRFRLSQSLISSIVIWGGLLLNAGLWVVVLAALSNVLRDIFLLMVQYRNFFKPFYQETLTSLIDWKTEILPMQWRLALSGVVNYFAFSLFVPVMANYHGLVVAGQMGMTMQMVGALQSISLMWVYTRAPVFGIMVAQKDYSTLDREWFKTSLQSITVLILAALSLFFAVWLLNYLHIAISSRILPALPISLLLIATIFMHISQCQTIYLRAHKREPIFLMSIVSSILIGVLVWQLGRLFGATGSIVGYMSIIILVIVPWETYIWQKAKKDWHL